MWIVPLSIISAYAPGTGALTLDSSEFCQAAELSLTWRSKPSPSLTWLRRWKRENWIQHLCGRMLKRSLLSHFAIWWTSSLAAIRANRSASQACGKGRKTQDTSGRFCAEQFELFSPDEYSSRTSRGTSRLDSQRCSAIWKRMVTKVRGEYSARLKSVRRTSASVSSSSGNWPTPAAHEARLGYQDRSNGKKGSQKSLTTVVLEDGQPGQVRRSGNGRSQGSLSPNWTEQLMGVPVGWTQLPTEWIASVSSATASAHQQQARHGLS